MHQPLWVKSDTAIDERIMHFMAGDDLALDAALVPYDLRATAAHVRGLVEIDLFEPEEAEAVLAALDAIADAYAAGTLVLDSRWEDGHSAIEGWLTERLGDLGKRVHVGRSRNDQVLVATRLYTLDALRLLRANAVAAAGACLRLARQHADVVMPGYTHLQRAVPSTVGLWMASFVESFTDDVTVIDAAIDLLDACPLGTAAGYGVNLALPRERVARELGFSRLQVNPMAAQASRGKHEVQALAAAWQVCQTIRRLGWDLVLFSTAEFGFVVLPPEATTGSSIMPNKRNPDLAELLRAAAASVAGAMNELQQAISLPSGYHRDLQVTKPPLMRGLRTACDASSLVSDLVDGLRIEPRRMRIACEPSMLATDLAVELAAGGMPFRDAYRRVGESLDSITNRDPSTSTAARLSPGACADLRLDALGARLSALDERPLVTVETVPATV